MGKEKLTIEVDADLMERLRAAGVDPQAYVQRLLDRQAYAHESERDWAEQNKEAIAEYNQEVAERGVFSRRIRDAR